MKPGPGKGPVSLGGTAGDAQHLGNLRERQSGEAVQLDEFCECVIFRGKVLESFIQGKEVLRTDLRVVGKVLHFKIGQPAMSPPPLRLFFRRAFSIRMRRMASAAAMKK